MSEDYRAIFEISHGVSHGFGLVYDINSTEERVLNAENDIDALEKAEKQARSFAREYLANTTGYKTIEVTLKNNQGKEIDQTNLIKREAEKNLSYNRSRENFEIALNLLFPNGKLTVKRSWLEDLAEIEKLVV